MAPKRTLTRSLWGVLLGSGDFGGRSDLTIGGRGIWLALFIGIIFGEACTTVPAPVVSPVAYRQRELFASLTSSVAFGDAQASIRRPDGTLQVITGNGEHSWGIPETDVTLLGMFIPAMVAFHFAGPLVDGGAYIGWRGIGALARTHLWVTTFVAFPASPTCNSPTSHWTMA
jgi:hypothetical protein